MIQPRLIKLLGQICALHTKPNEKVLELEYQTNGFGSDYAHPRFISMMLRLGDLLDIDNNRFNTGAELSFGGLPLHPYRIKKSIMLQLRFLLHLKKYALKVIAQILSHTLKPDALFPGLIMR